MVGQIGPQYQSDARALNVFRAQRQRCPETDSIARLVDAETGNHLSAFLDHALGCLSGEVGAAPGTKRSAICCVSAHRVYGPALPAAILLIGIGAMGMGGAAAQGSPRGSPGLHAGCDAALFGVHFGRVANHEMHDGQASTVESGVPGGHGTRDFPPRVSALLSALQTLHARLLPLIS